MALPLLFLGLSAVGTALQFKASSDAADAQEEQQEINQAQQRIKDSENLRKQARQANIQRAKIQQASEATGTSGSSREFSAIGSLDSQVAANAGRLAGQQQTAQVLGGLNQDIANAQVLKAGGSAISSISNTAFSASGGFDSIFKKDV